MMKGQCTRQSAVGPRMPAVQSMMARLTSMSDSLFVKRLQTSQVRKTDLQGTGVEGGGNARQKAVS